MKGRKVKPAIKTYDPRVLEPALTPGLIFSTVLIYVSVCVCWCLFGNLTHEYVRTFLPVSLSMYGDYVLQSSSQGILA